MPYYKDVREYLDALDSAGKLVRIRQSINKDTELHPLVRLQYRGLSEEQRRAFLFERVTDVRGRNFNISECGVAKKRFTESGLMPRPIR